MSPSIVSFVKIDFMVEPLYWTALDCTGVTNKGGPECTARMVSELSQKLILQRDSR